MGGFWPLKDGLIIFLIKIKNPWETGMKGRIPLRAVWFPTKQIINQMDQQTLKLLGVCSTLPGLTIGRENSRCAGKAQGDTGRIG